MIYIYGSDCYLPRPLPLGLRYEPFSHATEMNRGSSEFWIILDLLQACQLRYQRGWDLNYRHKILFYLYYLKL